jgi:HAD superfamily hydrolase (TIGR01509 family)
MMLKGIIFDMDGVLIDSEPLHKKIEQQMLIELGVDLPHDEHIKFAGVGKEFWNIIKNRFGYNREVTAEWLHEEKRDRYLKALSAKPIIAIEGVIDVVTEARKKNIPLAVASSSSSYLIHLVLKAIGIDQDISYVVSGEEVPRNKPFPDIFLRTAELMKIAPEECLVVEDSANGVKAAKDAGMFCVAFLNMNSGKQDLSKADHIVRAMNEVIEYI